MTSVIMHKRVPGVMLHDWCSSPCSRQLKNAGGLTSITEQQLLLAEHMPIVDAEHGRYVVGQGGVHRSSQGYSAQHVKPTYSKISDEIMP